jgi:hypothetical protein
MNFSRGWAKECTGFTSNRKIPPPGITPAAKLQPGFSTFIHRQGLLCTGKSPQSREATISILAAVRAFIDFFHTQV